MIESQVFTRLVGDVIEFDEAKGLGVVQSGSLKCRFHCIEIVDGTRSVAIGAHVSFVLEPRMGDYEATRLDVVDAAK